MLGGEKEMPKEIIQKLKHPVCLECGKELALKLHAVNDMTHEGYGYFYPTCECNREVKEDGEIID